MSFGVVALIIEAHGTPDGSGGYDLAPDAVYRDPRDIDGDRDSVPGPGAARATRRRVGRASWNATCVGTAAYNSNYGFGIVNVALAVTSV